MEIKIGFAYPVPRNINKSYINKAVIFHFLGHRQLRPVVSVVFFSLVRRPLVLKSKSLLGTFTGFQFIFEDFAKP